ncbi:MAG: hypothetical protein ACREMN_10985 [Gemmatimonadales bacterium]
MPTPPSAHSGPPPRPAVGRSSFAMAMKDYTFIRPGVAITISAVTLVLALVIGFSLIMSLRDIAASMEHGSRTVEALHRYNAGLEVWRDMSTSTDPAYQRPEAVAQRDRLGRALRGQLAELATTMDDRERELVNQVLTGLTSTGPVEGAPARQAMIVLLARQDAAIYRAAQASQRAVLQSAALLALTLITAGTLVIPMAWLYIRHKRGATIEVKV